MTPWACSAPSNLMATASRWSSATSPIGSSPPPTRSRDLGLHGGYVFGPRVAIERGSERDLADRLSNFRLSLYQDGGQVADGGGDLVLGSPLNALAHLIDVLASLPDHPPLAAGELITTGTLTAAMPVVPGQTWSTRLEGLDLPSLTLRFT